MNKALILLTLLAVSFATERVVENNAADALVNEIQRMEGEIRQEQQKHHQLWEEQEVECATEFTFRQQEINDANAAYDNAVAAQGRCENALTASEADLEKSRNYVSAINEILSSLAAQRLAEATSYHTLVNDELTPAINAVEGAFPILRDFASQATSFVEFSSHVNSMFTKMIKAKKVNQFSAILTTLLQAPEFQHGISHDVINQLELLFDNLLQDLQNALDNATEVENAAITKYEQTVSEYGAILANLNATINNLENYIVELQACVNNESAIAGSADAKRRRNQDSLNYAVDMCQAFETEYNNATTARNEELSLLAKLRSFVREQEQIFGNYGDDSDSDFEQEKELFENQQRERNSQKDDKDDHGGRNEERKKFMQMKIQKFKIDPPQKPALPSRCSTCSRKSFVQKKLGF